MAYAGARQPSSRSPLADPATGISPPTSAIDSLVAAAQRLSGWQAAGSVPAGWEGAAGLWELATCSAGLQHQGRAPGHWGAARAAGPVAKACCGWWMPRRPRDSTLGLAFCRGESGGGIGPAPVSAIYPPCFWPNGGLGPPSRPASPGPRPSAVASACNENNPRRRLRCLNVNLLVLLMPPIQMAPTRLFLNSTRAPHPGELAPQCVGGSGGWPCRRSLVCQASGPPKPVRVHPSHWSVTQDAFQPVFTPLLYQGGLRRALVSGRRNWPSPLALRLVGVTARPNVERAAGGGHPT